MSNTKNEDRTRRLREMARIYADLQDTSILHIPSTEQPHHYLFGDGKIIVPPRVFEFNEDWSDDKIQEELKRFVAGLSNVNGISTRICKRSKKKVPVVMTATTLKISGQLDKMWNIHCPWCVMSIKTTRRFGGRNRKNRRIMMAYRGLASESRGALVTGPHYCR